MYVHEKNYDGGNIHEKNMIEVVKLQCIFLHVGAVYVGCLWLLDLQTTKMKKNVDNYGKYKTASVCLLLHCSFMYMYGPGALKTIAISVTVVQFHKSEHKISVSPSSSG